MRQIPRYVHAIENFFSEGVCGIIVPGGRLEREMTLDEAELVSRAVEGDRDALSQLLCAHGPAVERGLRIDSQWQSVLDTADVMQVTYLEAFSSIDTFNPDEAGAFKAWLAQIANNNLLDATRALGRKKRPQPRDRVIPKSDEDSLVGLYLALGVTSTTPSRQVGAKEIGLLIESAVDRLPADYGQVIRLYDLEEKPIGEVAEMMRRSAGAVHMLRVRAHDHLRRMLGSASVFFSSGA